GSGRCPGDRRDRQDRARPDGALRLAKPAGVRGQPHARTVAMAAQGGSAPARSRVEGVRPAQVLPERHAFDQAGMDGADRHLHAPRLRAGLQGRGETRAVRSELEGRLLLSLPPLALRPRRARVRRRAGTAEHGGAAVPLRRCLPHPDRRRSERSRVMRALMQWFEERAPGAGAAYKKHMTEYYAPKNFNVMYYFGSLALLVLVNQIVTGILLTMFYTPTAAGAFDSVQYIMRDVHWGWLVRYMHVTGASMFFIVVYLHMFRGLMYGSNKKPRELVWLLGMLIFLALMAEAFMGYVL